MSLRAELEARVQSWTQTHYPQMGAGPWVRPCADPRHGHFQTHLPMAAGKQAGENPKEIATRLAQECTPPEGWETPQIAGNGFVNYRVSPAAVANAVGRLRKDPSLGICPTTRPETIVVDFSSPNIAKAMHVGHIRSTLLGDSLSRLLTRCGHRVIRINHLGDWGTQFGKLLLAYRSAGRPALDPARSIEQLEEFYKKGHEEAEADPKKMDQARAELASVVEDLLKKGIAETSQGAVVVTNPEISEEPFLIRKSDGAFLYGTTDLAALQSRIRDLRAQRIIYVTDGRQQLHFRWLFDTAKRWGVQIPLEHVWFGTILGPDRKPLKSRDGSPIKLIDLLEEAKDRAKKILLEKRPDLTGTALEDKAELLGIASLKYADQMPGRNLDYVFTWEKLLAFDGNTAPYILNAYVRSRSILRKAGVTTPPHHPILLEEPAEEELSRQLLRFADVIELAAHDRRPHHLCGYLFETAGMFHRYFEACPVLQAKSPALQQSRLTLTGLTGDVLREGLQLLGIPTLEEM